jgi:hypothetical protein
MFHFLPTALRTILAVALLTWSLPSLASRRALIRCPGGRFVAHDVAPRISAPADPMVLDLSVSGGGLHVLGGGHGCTRPPDSVRLRPRRRFTRVTARWNACEGLEGPVSFRGRIGPGCNVLKGSLITQRATPKTRRVTAELACPLDAGRYTLTPSDVATLDISGLLSTSISVQPVGLEAGPGDAACRHETVVPYPGGFEKGIGCFENATFAFEQAGCGVGLIDSDGGSDFTLSETADTSDRAVCNVPQHPACLSQSDQSLRIDVTVGDGTADTCSGAGTGNVLLSIPIAVTVWIDRDGCPAPDGTFDAGFDSLVARVEQVANLTTATASAQFADLDGDGCAFAGTSAGPVATAGTCLEVIGGSLTLVATGAGGAQTIGDIVSSLRVPLTISSPATGGGEVCGTVPPTPIRGGTAVRCSVPPGCGDGIVGVGEECDGPSDASCPGGCRGDCRCAQCMNDVVEAGEDCDWSDDEACPQRCQSDCTCAAPATP